ncbi:MAG: sugar-binding protein [Kiritimatiellae bacterium]|nr:sugar-binding protein [Kiritimatiellia bacterium]
MDMIKTIFYVMALVASASCADAVERPSYPCHRLAQSPVIDGKVNDAAWQNMPEAIGFYIYRGAGEYAVEKQTSFKAGWTEEALYLAVRAEEPNPEKLRTTGTVLWQDDSMELMLFPSGAPTYTQLLVNSRGDRSGGRPAREYKLAMTDWEAAVSVGKTEWALEMRVPFKILMGDPVKEGDEWAVNVGRYIFTGPPEERVTCWPFLEKGFHDVPNFGKFVFKGNIGDDVHAAEKEINRVYTRHMADKIKKLAGAAEQYKKNLAEIKTAGSEGEEVENLLRVWDRAVKMAAEPEPDVRDLILLSRDCVKLQRRSKECVARVKLEVLLAD